MHDQAEIGFENGDAWVQAELTDQNTVVLDKYCDVPLNANQCIDLARWLLDAAAKMTR
jgi:hypothetical protein